jgi:hypothetical protein
MLRTCESALASEASAQELVKTSLSTHPFTKTPLIKPGLADLTLLNEPSITFIQGDIRDT